MIQTSALSHGSLFSLDEIYESTCTVVGDLFHLIFCSPHLAVVQINPQERTVIRLYPTSTHYLHLFLSCIFYYCALFTDIHTGKVRVPSAILHLCHTTERNRTCV